MKIGHMIYMASALLLLFCLSITLPTSTAQAANWSSTAPMSNVRSGHTSTLLSNGKILVVGGYETTSPLVSAEIFDPVTNSWSSAGSLATARSGHTATMLPNGKVLVVGGYDSATSLASSELYDPATNMWSAAVGSLASARSAHAAVLLPSGKLLVTGGMGTNGYLSSAELYDPATNSWNPAGTLTSSRYFHTSTLLPNSKVLVAGGAGESGYPTNVELYDVVDNSWSSIASMETGRYGHSATLLPNGKIMIAGGENGGGYLASAELYDPGTNSWSVAGSLTNARSRHSVTLLPDGKILVVGGAYQNNYLNSVELYDPVNNSWATAGTLTTGRKAHCATLLPNATVLITGGISTGGGSVASVELFNLSTPTWSPGGDLTTIRYNHSATLLPNGNILVVGGGEAPGGVFSPFPTNVELYNPSTGVWSTTWSQIVASRYSHTATLLSTGKVLLAGGYNGSGYLTSADLYDPVTSSWENVGATARVYHSATLLPDGRVLVAGGYDNNNPLSSAELFNPATNSWSPAGTMVTARYLHSATLLPNGKVLVAGGYGNTALSTAELYDPATNSWSSVTAMTMSRFSHTATLLPVGKVLVTGGFGNTALSAAELYDPTSNSWSPAGAMATARYFHSATLLPNGKVLVAGGYNASVTEMYDPATNSWSPAGVMSTVRYYHSATLLPNGKLLVAGGFNGNAYLAGSELFDSTPGISDTRRPLINSIVNTTGKLTFSGSAFQGDSEASSGATNSSSSNYPLLQLRRLDNEQTLFLGVDASTPWSTTSLSSHPVSSLTAGDYSATIYVNGVPSLAKTVIIGPTVTVSPSLIDFGSVSQPTAKTVSISNSGNQNLVISSVTTVGSDGMFFSLTYGNGIGGTCVNSVLPPGSSCTIELYFIPTTGSKNSRLRIISNDISAPVRDIALAGIGTRLPFINGIAHASSVTSESATLNGDVYSFGIDTTVTFQYGLTDSYGSTASAGIINFNYGPPTAVSTSISGLACGTTYHFRVTATNGAGTAYGDDQIFTTSSSCIVTPSVVFNGGGLAPSTPQLVVSGNTLNFNFSFYPESHLTGVSGTCPVGSFNDPYYAFGYTTGVITNNCTVIANYVHNPVNGVCGSANATITATPPTANLCSDGSLPTVSGSGRWSWSCAGQYGGAPASCAAFTNTQYAIPGDSVRVAGGGFGYNGQATSACLGCVGGIAADANGNSYFADRERILKVTAATGIITVIAGGGVNTGSAAEGVPATTASISPDRVVLDNSGNLYFSDTGMVRKVALASGILTTVAGGGTVTGIAADGGSATSAQLSGIADIAVDTSGNLYISESYRIRKVALGSGIITTVAGNGSYGYSGDGGDAKSAKIYGNGVAIDTAGNLYIADYNRVRKVVLGTGIITTVAGNGTYSDYYNLVNGVAAVSTPVSARRVAVDNAGNLYIVPDTYVPVRKVTISSGIITAVTGNYVPDGGGTAVNSGVMSAQSIVFDSSNNMYISFGCGSRVQKLTAATGNVTTIAGTGSQGFGGDGGAAVNATLTSSDAVVDSAGNIFIADSGNNRIRKVAATSGIITTVAGNGNSYPFSGDGGPATLATINSPGNIALDNAGNLFIVENYNVRVRRVDAATGIITTVAGNGEWGSSGDGGLAINAAIQPNYIAVDSVGNLYISDTTNKRVRKVDVNSGIITTIAGGGNFLIDPFNGVLGDGELATAVPLAGPKGIAVDNGGNIFIADVDNNSIPPARIRRVDASTRVISTVAGGGFFEPAGRLATTVHLGGPSKLAIDASGNLFFQDYFGVFKLSAATGIITPVPTQASGLALDTSGNIYFNDSNGYFVKLLLSGMLPAVSAVSTSTVSQTGAILDASVSDNGADTMVSFQYALGKNYTDSVSVGKVSAGTGSTTVNASLSGLTCNTTYHYRAVVQNSAGTAYSNDATFITAPCPAAGVCGSANAGIFTIAPASNLCLPAADVSVSTTDKGWSWSCPGRYGGQATSCTADIRTWPVTGYSYNPYGTVSCTTPVKHGSSTKCTFTPIDGYRLNYYSVNDNGTGSTMESVTAPLTIAALFVDDIKPVLAISSLADGAKTAEEILNITGSASDASGITSLTINGVDLTSRASAFSHAIRLAKAPATNTITTVVTDANNQTTTDIRTITYDPAMPNIVLTSAPPDGSIQNIGTTTISGLVSDSGAAITVALNGNSMGTFTGPVFSQELTLVHGMNTITVTVTDANDATRTNTIKRTVFYDTTHPALAVTTPVQDMTTSNSSLLLTGTVSDNQSSISISSDGHIYTPAVIDGSFTQQIDFTELKTYVITVTATDSAGHSISVTRNIIYQTLFLVTPTIGAGGSIAPQIPLQVVNNSTLQLTLTPSPGYHVNTAGVTGTCPVGSFSGIGNTMYTTGVISASCTVNFGFTHDPVNAVCGGANSSIVAVAPSTSLCSDGTLPGVSGSGPWNWSCAGQYGGSSANCSAEKLVNPAFTSAANTSMVVSTPGSFAVTATGYPKPSLSYSGTLPGGISLIDNNNGTASISGTPIAGTAGSYPITLTATNQGTAVSQTFTLTVSKATAVVTLSNLTQIYDGTGKTASVSTTPNSLAYTITYNGSTIAPTAIGSYTVAVSINDTNYQGSSSGTLVINPALHTLAIAIAGNGTGTVTSSPAGISCTTTNCTGSLAGTVTLYATPSILSKFSGWGSACINSGTAATCTVTMDTDKTVTATFNLATLLHIEGSPYTSLQQAYAAATDGDVIQMLQTPNTVLGTLTADKPITVKLKGGYDVNYSATITGTTTISSTVTIKQGKVIMDRIVVK